ncbi:MAG: RecQ family ATP-dependent DNA helicase [Bacteroidales bacterium]|nr:RecQ family ATP-dependent DNA helicase [Bacteroidales bacterium]
MASPLEVLKKYWGYDTFRPLQEDVITSIISGVDTLALFPTGGGKSLCYQIPALCMDGICVVVSPLIALMKDQTQHLNDKGIRAVCLTSDMNHRQFELVLNNCVSGRIKLLYVSPERLKNMTFLSHLRQMKVSMVAVDEAHCISQWGYDFRPAYLDVGKIRSLLPGVPMLALTATATPIVEEDVCRLLFFRKGFRVFRASFARENLSYVVSKEADKFTRLLKMLNGVPGSAIVYVRNRRHTSEVASFLRGHGISAAHYHAGMEARDRDRAQLAWTSGQCRVIVATNAFGMGIDKSDVRLVVHLDVPSSVEAYYQEAGRAGRDGRRSFAAILYTDDDVAYTDVALSNNYPPISQIRSVYRALGNFYQVPIGSGDGRSFDFDMEKICNTYGFKVPEFYGALRLLEREGLISMPDRNEAESMVNILLTPQEVYLFQMQNVKYGDLLTVLMRLYGGLYSSFVPISERKIATRCHVPDENRIVRMLQHLDALKVISYKQKSIKPQLIFTQSRINDADMMLSDDVYANQLDAARKRVNAMKDYVAMSEGCRSRFLLDYLGEKSDSRCGACDLCIADRKQSMLSLQERIVGALKSSDMVLESLVSAVLPADGVGESIMEEKEVVQALRQLMDRGEVTQLSDFVLHYKGAR